MDRKREKSLFDFQSFFFHHILSKRRKLIDFEVFARIQSWLECSRVKVKIGQSNALNYTFTPTNWRSVRFLFLLHSIITHVFFSIQNSILTKLDAFAINQNTSFAFICIVNFSTVGFQLLFYSLDSLIISKCNQTFFFSSCLSTTENFAQETDGLTT